MLYIGCHLSASKGYEDMGKQALSINANTFAFFTRNPRGGSAKAISVEDTEKFLKLAKENNFDYFTTTLSVSPHKVSKWINEILESLSTDKCKYLYSDFKKENG